MGRIVSPSGQAGFLGKDGYVMVTATANMGNGQHAGTHQEDSALRNRFGVVLDFNYSKFQPTQEDLELITQMTSANPGVKDAPIRDISDKIILANREIALSTRNIGLEARAAMSFLQFGLKQCKGDGNKVKRGVKEGEWYNKCIDCGVNSDNKAPCSRAREIDGRTIQALPRYASALQYLALLKNPKAQIDATALVFKAFELTAAHQDCLNPIVLARDYNGDNLRMMSNVADELRTKYDEEKDKILTVLEAAQKGMDHRDLSIVQDNNSIRIGAGFSKLRPKIIENIVKAGGTIQKIDFKDDMFGFEWVLDSGDITKAIAKARKENPEKSSEEANK